ncbi:MAG: preprotein translocase subunit SecY, partial [Victivallales bacterium]|nr:preprotein translocase subunit SecY [Victivallales bacterium]
VILSFPMMLMRFLPNWPWIGRILSWFQYGSTPYVILYAIMILLFSFFWVANQFNPVRISEDLQKQGGYIPSVQPGAPTAEFLDHAMTRITFAGAIFLTVLAVFPMILSQKLSINPQIAQFFGGTSLLIIVGVGLDTLRQMEGYLMAHHYDGFMSSGRLRSRR